MLFAKHNIFTLATAVMTVLSIGAGAAMANPVGTITVVNNGTETAVYDHASSGTGGVFVSPAFTDIEPGSSKTFTVTSKYEDFLSMRLEYDTLSFVTCDWYIVRGSKYKYDWNVLPSHRTTWKDPTIELEPGSHSSKCSSSSYGSNTGKPVSTSYGNFSARLIIK